ncbi:phosphatidate cytidylyltransferase [Hellea sp.]|nr:phosphatidate cytidylyltransferase [Hellea sp.]
MEISTVEKKPLFKNVGVRAATALLFAAICIPPLYFGGWPWAILVALLGARMMWEWVRMSDPVPTRLAYIIPIIGVVITCFYMAQKNPLFAITTIAIAAVLAAIERARRGGLLWSGLGYLYIVIPSAAIVGIRGVENGFATEGFTKLIYVISIVVAADVGAYFGGSFFKGPKLAPKLSPNKTWSGFLSGMFSGALMGGIVGQIVGLGFLPGAALAVPLVILSVLGDLLESGLKRSLNVKDAGDLLPGHGGLLDRLDSLMMAVVGALVILTIAPNFWPI